MERESLKWQWLDAERLSADPSIECEVLGLLGQVISGENRLGFDSENAPKAARWLFDYISAMNKLGLAHWLVCRSDLGAISSAVLETAVAPSQRHIATVRFLAVREDVRALDLLMLGAERVVERCREVGVEYLLVDTRKGSPLERLWKMFGFTEYANLACYARVAGASLSGVFLREAVADLETRIAKRRANGRDRRP